jgi:hypothetical protein
MDILSSLSVSDDYLLMQAGISSKTYHLGNLCNRQHDWNSTGRTLRFNSDNSCPLCRGVDHIGSRSVPDDDYHNRLLEDAGFDTTKFMLGCMCKYGHNWEFTGRSLRRRSNPDAVWVKKLKNPPPGICLECEKIKREKKYKNRKRLTYRTIDERFWEKVAIKGKDDCWDWTASLNHSGYGKFGISSYETKIFGVKNSGPIGAHRVAFYLANGTIDNNLMVLHSCDRPSCCNPNHLRQGDAKDNGEDIANRARGTIGEKSIFLKLTDDEIREMRYLYENEDWGSAQLAAKFNCSRSHVNEVVSYRSRRHVK